MMHRSQGATALLGMPGFVVGAQLEADGEWWLHVETTAEVAGCAACGTRAVGHGRSRNARMAAIRRGAVSSRSAAWSPFGITTHWRSKVPSLAGSRS